MMDYDKLISAVKLCGSTPKADQCKQCAYWSGGDMSECIPQMTADAALAIETLRADLARVTAERDAAVADLTFAVNKYRLFTTDIDLCYLCKFNFPSSGENEQTYECPGCYGDDCFEWRGPQKED